MPLSLPELQAVGVTAAHVVSIPTLCLAVDRCLGPWPRSGEMRPCCLPTASSLGLGQGTTVQKVALRRS